MQGWISVGVVAIALLSGGCGGSTYEPTVPSTAVTSSTQLDPNAQPFTIVGTAVVLGRDYEPRRRTTFVQVQASPRSSPGGYCASVTARADGSFRLELPPSCFSENQEAFLRVNDSPTCTSVVFTSGGRATVTLIGRPEPFCGMVVKGQAGYAWSHPQFHSTFVGAWAGPGDVGFCSQTLGAADGTFTLKIHEPCFTDGSLVYLTSGGVGTCVTVRYRRAAIQRGLVLLATYSCP
jgi:hypothetical protein